MRLLDFSDGFSSSQEPTSTALTATSLAVYANDAAFVAAKGAAAAEGDIYANSTDHLIHYYNGSAWQVIGSLSVGGSRGTPQNITAGGGITATTSLKNVQFVQGSGGPVTVTANPRISAGTTVGQELRLVGRSDVNTLTLDDGNGLSLKGMCILEADRVLDLMWDGTNWLEVGRI